MSGHTSGPIAWTYVSQVLEEFKDKLKGLEESLKITLKGGPLGTLINFDNAPNGNQVQDGTQLDVAGNPYANLGVIFKAIPGGQGQIPPGGVYARSFQQGATSPPNIVSLALPNVLPGDNESYGKIEVQFTKTCGTVTVWVKVATPLEYLGGPGPLPILQAYSSDPTLNPNLQPIATSSFPSTSVPLQPGTISAAFPLMIVHLNINYVTFSCPVTPLGNNLTAFFDDLSFM